MSYLPTMTGSGDADGRGALLKVGAVQDWGIRGLWRCGWAPEQTQASLDRFLNRDLSALGLQSGEALRTHLGFQSF